MIRELEMKISLVFEKRLMPGIDNPSWALVEGEAFYLAPPEKVDPGLALAFTWIGRLLTSNVAY